MIGTAVGTAPTCCVDHECDYCPTCLSGTCCGDAVVDRALPEQGSWPHPIHAPLGALVELDGKVVCHVCGTTWHHLFAHIRSHGMDAAVYRAYFGLRVKEPLVSQFIRDQRSGHSPPRPNQSPPTLTAEQRREVTARREQRMQAQRSGRHNSEQQREWARMQGPKTREQRTAISRAKRKYDPGHKCPSCDAFICTWTHRGGASTKRTLCGERACLSEARRRAAAIANRKRWG